MNATPHSLTRNSLAPVPLTRPLEIVIADDESVIREFLAKVCRHFGHQVVAIAENGQELVDVSLATLPDLIITDLMMPQVDGLTALEQIRKVATIKSIVISAHDREDFRERARQLGACAYLIKPVGISGLGPALELATSSST